MAGARTRAGTGQGVKWEWTALTANGYTETITSLTGWATLGILVTGNVDETTDEVDVSDITMDWDTYIPTTSNADGSLTVRHAQGDPGYQTLITWKMAPTIVWFRITEKDGSTIVFAGFTKGHKVTFARKDVVDAEVPFRVNTRPVFTPKAAT